MNNNYISSNHKKINIDTFLEKYPSNHHELEKDTQLNVDEYMQRYKRRENIRNARNRKRKYRNYIKKQIMVFFLGLTIVIGISSQMIQLVKITGASMEPTLNEGNYKFLNKRAYYNIEPERFDVIAFELIEGSEYYYIKRVIGLPGESIRVEHGSIFINGDYLLDRISAGVTEPLSAKVDIELGENEYFVLGDNRVESLDSRDKNFGNVKRELILGKIYMGE